MTDNGIEYFYVIGDAYTDGSIRHPLDPDGISITESRANGVWSKSDVEVSGTINGASTIEELTDIISKRAKIDTENKK